MSDEQNPDCVLMIDDEKDILDFFAQAFENFKHIRFITSVSAHEGIEIAKRERPKVVLLDLRMPGMSGEEALRELKRFLPTSKFVISTAWNDGETKARIMKSGGVDEYFEKPLDFEKVVNKIIQLVMIK